ncbi:MAG: RnfABCDGE type electron transport complex subunit D [Planctomycetota bacterium]
MSYRLPHILAVSLPLIGGVVMFGWRGAGVIALVLGAGLVTSVLLCKVGRRGRHLQTTDVVWALLAVCLLLPAALASAAGLPWAIGIGALVTLAVWGFGGPATSRVPIPAVAVLLVGIVQPSRLEQPAVLGAERPMVGDVLVFETTTPPERPWYRREMGTIAFEPPAVALQKHTMGIVDPDLLLRDALPPFADVVLGATPTALGGSALLTLAALLLLAKTNRFDALLPMLALCVAYVMLMALPHAGNGWGLFASFGDGWLAGLTFVHYQLLSGPFLVTVALLAAMPGIRPMSLQGRIVFATILGTLSAVLQVYLSTSLGPLIALCGVALLTPVLDRHALPRPLL